MKVEIEVPRTFEITLEQMDKFLTASGWSEKQNHNKLTCKYQCIKYPNVFVFLPKAEGKVVDEENMMFSALRLIANENNNCGIETIVNRVLGEDNGWIKDEGLGSNTKSTILLCEAESRRLLIKG